MKKKIISVVLVMTMVFALLAVSASARPVTPNYITSIALTAPASLSEGQTVAQVKALFSESGDDYEIYAKHVVFQGFPKEDSHELTKGTYVIGVVLKASDDMYFDRNSIVWPQGAREVVYATYPLLTLLPPQTYSCLGACGGVDLQVPDSLEGCVW